MICVEMGVISNAPHRRLMAAIGTTAGIALAVVAASCGNSVPMGSTPMGGVTGTFQIVTGGVEYRDVPGLGHVVVSRGTRHVAGQSVESGGSFDIRVPSGPIRSAPPA
jgi:hypothetical protein